MVDWSCGLDEDEQERRRAANGVSRSGRTGATL
jgi:hypothetical protein